MLRIGAWSLASHQLRGSANPCREALPRRCARKAPRANFGMAPASTIARKGVFEDIESAGGAALSDAALERLASAWRGAPLAEGRAAGAYSGLDAGRSFWFRLNDAHPAP